MARDRPTNGSDRGFARSILIRLGRGGLEDSVWHPSHELVQLLYVCGMSLLFESAKY